MRAARTSDSGIGFVDPVVVLVVLVVLEGERSRE